MVFVNYIVSILFIILWAIGFFTHLGGTPIHFLLIGAFTLILINILTNHHNNNPNSKNKHLIN